MPRSGASLYFSGKKVTDEHMIRNLPAFHDVSSLTFSESTAISDKTLAVIPQLQWLKQLQIGSDHVTGSGIHHLEKCKHLISLSIRSNSLTDEHLVHLRRLAGLPITGLNVGGNGCTHVGLSHIEVFKNLTSLEIQTGIGEKGEALVDGEIMRAIGKMSTLSTLSIRLFRRICGFNLIQELLLPRKLR